jgi:hypothetical protein
MAEEKEEASKDVKIFYEKSPLYRTVRATGAWAGITPQGEVQIMVFNDLRPLPEFVRQEITDDRTLGKEIEKVERKGVLREIEVNIAIAPDVAIALVGLIEQMLEQLRQKGLLQAQAKPEQTEGGN